MRPDVKRAMDLRHEYDNQDKIASLRQQLSAVTLERDTWRASKLQQRKADGFDHVTNCAIWGNDGQGNLDGVPTKAPCSCGALENWFKHKLFAEQAAHTETKQKADFFQRGRGFAYEENANLRFRLADATNEAVMLDAKPSVASGSA